MCDQVYNQLHGKGSGEFSIGRVMGPHWVGSMGWNHVTCCCFHGQTVCWLQLHGLIENPVHFVICSLFSNGHKFEPRSQFSENTVCLYIWLPGFGDPESHWFPSVAGFAASTTPKKWESHWELHIMIWLKIQKICQTNSNYLQKSWLWFWGPSFFGPPGDSTWRQDAQGSQPWRSRPLLGDHLRPGVCLLHFWIFFAMSWSDYVQLDCSGLLCYGTVWQKLANHFQTHVSAHCKLVGLCGGPIVFGLNVQQPCRENVWALFKTLYPHFM